MIQQLTSQLYHPQCFGNGNTKYGLRWIRILLQYGLSLKARIMNTDGAAILVMGGSS